VPASAGRRGGFTLLEILISLLILIVALVSIFALFGAASASHRRAVSSQNAAQLAYVILAELEQVPNPQTLNAIADGTHPDFDGYTYDITFTPVGANEIQADVRIKWKRGGQDLGETFRTILLAR
jgi:Tfp pilus assembly protein PilV